MKASLSKTAYWTLFIVIVGSFLFYWYELRPLRIYRRCEADASMDARNLLASKAEIAGNTERGASYRSLIDRNMYLRSDYQSFLNKCLLHYGMPRYEDAEETEESNESEE